MKEVSCQQLNVLFNALDNAGISRRRLIEGSPFVLKFLENGRNRIDWDDYVDLQRRFGELIGAGRAELEAIGASSFDTYIKDPVVGIVGYLVSPHRLYWAISRWGGPKNFANVVSTYEALPDKRIILTLEISSGYKECAEYFWICKGVFRLTPKLIGLPEALVEADIAPRRAVFTITPPPSLTILARLRRVFTVVGAGRTAVEELKTQQAQLADSYEELSQTHLKLAESEERFRTLFETAFSGLIVHEAGLILDANTAATEMLGYSLEEVIGRPVSDFLDTASHAIVAAKLESGGDHNYEVEAVRKDGAPAYLEVVSQAHVHHGRPVRIAALRDITESKLMAEEIQKAEKLEAIGVVAGGIAHDFRNLLTVNLINIDLAQKYAGADNHIKTRTDKAKQAALRARDLTERLLTFSLGGVPVKNPTSLTALIKESLDFCLAGSDIECVAEIAGDLHAVEVDEGQIHQVVQNLIVNASQAMAGGGIVKVEANNVVVGRDENLPLAAGDYVLIKVKDNGSGIPKEIRAKIFDPFFTTKEGAAGLGLATSHAIVKKHGGHIFANSKAGKGSTFYVYLPASGPDQRVGQIGQES